MCVLWSQPQSMKNINDMGVKEFTIGKDQKMALKCCKRAIYNLFVLGREIHKLSTNLSVRY